MCGINGFNFSDQSLIKRMMKFTNNRGPDAEGVYTDDNISLAHNRLSIIDLDTRSNQPMRYKNFVISFVGEIYNFKSLKKELQESGHKFLTTSDTEVILHLFEKYNIEAFKKLSGIFTISIWDKLLKKLYLIRDTLGVKPLYYLENKKQKKFFFSSSIKSILLSVNKKELNEKALVFYENFGRNDDKQTIFRDIYKLLPGELLIISNNIITKKKFLNFNLKNRNLDNAEIKLLIRKSISRQLVSDVPIALSLSGGVDSNVVYSVMRDEIKKFNIYSFYFNDYEKFNEDFNIAKKNADFYGNNFIPVEINYRDFIDNSEKVVDILEEPSGNQCAVLNYVMSKKIHEKILMTGDGGDESFTGYDRYRSIHILNFLKKFNILRCSNFHSKFKNINRLFFKDPKDMFLSFSEQNIYKNTEIYYKNFKRINKNQLFLNHAKDLSLKDNLNSVSLIDLDTIVPNEYLLRNDKIFMNEGIEVRVPLLDTNIVNNFLKINEYKKFQYRFKSKALIKKIFHNDIHQLVSKKWGLQSPYAKWMKGPLQNFLKEVLSEGYYNNSKKYLNFNKIEELIKIHKERYFNPDLLWSLTMLQIFLRNFKL